MALCSCRNSKFSPVECSSSHRWWNNQLLAHHQAGTFVQDNRNSTWHCPRWPVLGLKDQSGCDQPSQSTLLYSHGWRPAYWWQREGHLGSSFFVSLMCLVIQAAHVCSPRHSPLCSRDGCQLLQLEQVYNRHTCSVSIYHITICIQLLEAVSDFKRH